jgi:hypothetical protein
MCVEYIVEQGNGKRRESYGHFSKSAVRGEGVHDVAVTRVSRLIDIQYSQRWMHQNQLSERRVVRRKTGEVQRSVHYEFLSLDQEKKKKLR